MNTTKKEVVALKANTPEERDALRKVISTAAIPWKECPCGWFFVDTKCPVEGCKKWAETRPKSRVARLFAHADKDTYYAVGKEFGLEGEALRTFANWGYEIKFEGEIDLQTGEVKFLTVDGHKIQY